MDIRVIGNGIEVNDRVEAYLAKKIGKLERYLPEATEAVVELRHEHTKDATKRNVVEVTLFDGRGAVLRGEERSADLYSAIDLVMDKMHRQIEKYKGKRVARARHQHKVEAAMNERLADLQEQEDAGEGPLKLVRVKRFAMGPMTPEEAIEQMELLGHNFFIFYNPDEGQVNVVYRRRDGNYGLIIPELV